MLDIALLLEMMVEELPPSSPSRESDCVVCDTVGVAVGSDAVGLAVGDDGGNSSTIMIVVVVAVLVCVTLFLILRDRDRRKTRQGRIQPTKIQPRPPQPVDHAQRQPELATSS